jgi:hypothetical protein
LHDDLQLPDDVTTVSPGLEEVPNFRRKDRFFNTEWKRSRKSRLANMRYRNIMTPGMLNWWNGKIEELRMQKATAQADWHKAAESARSVLAEMEKSRQFTSVEMLQVLGAIATLEDRSASVSDKRNSVKMIGDLFGLYNQRLQELAKKKIDAIDEESGEKDAEVVKVPEPGEALKPITTVGLLKRLRGGGRDDDAPVAAPTG